MIHKHIKSLPHHPKRVIVISLILAVALGFWGYTKINKRFSVPDISQNSNTEIESSTTSSHDLTLGFLVGGRIKSVSVKSGDKVLKGQILATLDAENTLGVLDQARAVYKTAEANYKKIINGATSTAIDVAKAAVNTAQVNLDGITTQQNLAVNTSYQNLLNSNLEAVSSSTSSDYTAPTISGNYILGKEGQIKINIYYTGNGPSFSVSGLATGSGIVTTINPQPIGDSGLYIKFPNTNAINVTEWIINIPNTKASNYLTNYNAYQSAVEAKSRVIASAQAVLDQANASLVALVTSARPEDVAVAQAQVDNAFGSVKIAEAAYNNTIITAPSDGTVLSVTITPGQIATPNAPAIEFISS